MTTDNPDLSPQEEINHAEIALNMLDQLPGLDNANTIAAAGVHATLALVQSNARIADLMSQQLIEQETANLFSLQQVMPPDHPTQVPLIHALQHRTIGCPGEEDAASSVEKVDTALLADCLATNELTVTSGDIVKVMLDGRELEIIVVEPSEDTWLFIQTDEYPMPVDSSIIAALIASDLALANFTVTPGSESAT